MFLGIAVTRLTLDQKFKSLIYIEQKKSVWFCPCSAWIMLDFDGKEQGCFRCCLFVCFLFGCDGTSSPAISLSKILCSAQHRRSCKKKILYEAISVCTNDLVNFIQQSVRDDEVILTRSGNIFQRSPPRKHLCQPYTTLESVTMSFLQTLSSCARALHELQLLKN